MGFAYIIKDQGAVHFVTFTVHQWVDVFTRSVYIDEILASIVFCQKEKGLEVFALVFHGFIMNNCMALKTKQDGIIYLQKAKL